MMQFCCDMEFALTIEPDCAAFMSTLHDLF